MASFDVALAKAIYERHEAQTEADVRRLRAKYKESVTFRDVRVSDIVLRLRTVYDTTDHILYAVDQLTHALQCYEMMRNEGVADRDMLALAFVHDIGKAWAQEEEEPVHNVMCCNRLVPGDYAPGCGLDELLFNFGHDEIAYMKLKDHVPEKVAFVLRYHSCRLVAPNSGGLKSVERYVSERDREHFPFLERFLRYDLASKDPFHVPDVPVAEVRSLLDGYFPTPVSL